MIEYDNIQFSKLVDSYVHSQRDRQILKDRYIDGLLFKELEDKYKLSERRLKDICYREFEKLIKYMHD